MAGSRVNAPNCVKCAHYFITHDVRFPYGCRAMGFKSQQSPQNEIIAATGTHCLAYEVRAAAAEARKP